MAGQKMYSSNTLTSARGLVHITGALSVNTAAASNSATIITGKMLKATGANGVVTVTLPEKYGTAEFIDCALVDTGKTGNDAVISTDYNPANGTFVFSIITSGGTAVTTGTFKVYICAEFALGM